MGDDIQYLFWNEIDQFEWNLNEFNDFAKSVYSWSREIASCEVSGLFLS